MKSMKQRPTLTSSNSSSTNTNNSMVTQGFLSTTSINPTIGGDAPLASQPIPPLESHYHDQAKFESDKRAVYKHPLFPLLALLFEKCEIATQTPAESAMSDSFHHDLEAFIQHQERDRKNFLANDPEVDGLMIKAIQVLRIHLLEMDKVQELCKDFCTRYITCLKGKMQSENLLRSDYYDASSNNGSTAMLTSSHSNSPHNSCYSSNGDVTPISPPTAGNSFHHAGLSFSSGIPSSIPPALLSNCNASPEHSSTGSHSSNSPTLVIHGGTPLSQIGANSNTGPTTSNSHESFLPTPNSPSSGEDEEDYMGRKKPKRGVLPKHATSIMRSWLFQHIVHPYPTEDEKRTIAAQTNLTLLQVNNWFINARRRILQPMLDATNPEPAGPKTKKLKTNGSKPALKYWSDNLATMGPASESGSGIGHHLGDSSEESEGESSNDGNDLMIDNSDSSQQ